MASVDYQNSILWRGEDPSKRKFKPKYDNSHKVERYFAGRAPRWATEEKKEDDQDEAVPPPQKRTRAQVDDAAANRLKRLTQTYVSAEERRLERLNRHRLVEEAAVIEDGDEAQVSKEDDDDKAGFKVKKEDSDEEKLILPRTGADEDDDDDDLDVQRPEAEQPASASAPKAEVKEEDDDLELRDHRRALLREQALQKRKEEEEALKEEIVEDDDEEVDEEEDSEDESSEEDPRSRALLKPVFVPKSQRDTVKEKENIEKEEELAREKQEEKLKERKVESKSLLIDHIKKDDEMEKAVHKDGLLDASDIELPDDDDEKDEAEEYDLWKIRELKRIKRDREERLTRQRELEWIERRRNMTDEERMAEDAKLEADAPKRDDVKQFNFLQKYYHRGAHFQDKATTGEEPLYLRDYHEPLAEEKYDKNLLPKAMQVRRGLFGKKGQVKHTHLTEVDTTDFSANWSQKNQEVIKYQEKMAAAKGANIFDRPSARGVGSSG